MELNQGQLVDLFAEISEIFEYDFFNDLDNSTDNTNLQDQLDQFKPTIPFRDHNYSICHGKQLNDQKRGYDGATVKSLEPAMPDSYTVDLESAADVVDETVTKSNHLQLKRRRGRPTKFESDFERTITKRAQNRIAAARYRQRKKSCEEVIYSGSTDLDMKKEVSKNTTCGRFQQFDSSR